MIFNAHRDSGVYRGGAIHTQGITTFCEVGPEKRKNTNKKFRIRPPTFTSLILYTPLNAVF